MNTSGLNGDRANKRLLELIEELNQLTAEVVGRVDVVVNPLAAVESRPIKLEERQKMCRECDHVGSGYICTISKIAQAGFIRDDKICFFASKEGVPGSMGPRGEFKG